ncbi:MAG: type II secretion system major pseudopilin GspG [Alphaproteobacteria bacterium]|nr:type II secretion system major pseudopilin GspG [Alphaproteobacteria bacterium]
MIKTLTLNQRRAQSGFSLMEILIVLVIIGTIMGLVAQQIFNKSDTANINAVKIQIENIKGALELYELNMARLPTTEEGLNALIEKPSNAEEATEWVSGGGPFLKSMPTDPFRKQPYKYELNQSGEPPYYLWTEGKPGKPETRIGVLPPQG